MCLINKIFFFFVNYLQIFSKVLENFIEIQMHLACSNRYNSKLIFKGEKVKNLKSNLELSYLIQFFSLIFM